MTLRGVAQWFDDRLNPIVVKELRQAVQSRFVIVVLLLFLVIQLLVVGIFVLFESGTPRGLGALERQGGRDLFGTLHGIMLGTCLLFIPLYTGIRLGAERSDSNVDLLFVTTLPPRAIISGKILASLMLAVMIFSSITPYLFFTYLLRGIDWPSIWFVIFVDFVAVVAGIHLAVFLAVIPGHWFFKGIIGLAGLAGLGCLFGAALGISNSLLFWYGTGLLDLPYFWPMATMMLTGTVGLCAMFYSWAVALLSPNSANRAFIPRLVFFFFWLVSLAVCLGWNYAGTGVQNEPMTIWIWTLGMLTCIQLLIAINERESWSPRTARTIPRAWWLRIPAFLFFSGAAGGVLFNCLLFALTIWIASMSSTLFVVTHAGYPVRWDALAWSIPIVLITGLYVYCYAMTAVLIRQTLARYVSPLFTWVIFLCTFAAGCVLPLISMMVFYDDWRYPTHYPWLLTIPFVAIDTLVDRRPGRPDTELFWFTAIGWAIAITILNLPWFLKQLRAFRSYQSASSSLGRMENLPQLTAAQAEVTRTLN